jgi:hypothetical protein
MSERRACTLIKADRRMVRYQSQLSAPRSSLAYQTPVAWAEKFAATDYHARPLRGFASQPVAQPAPPILQLENPKAAGRNFSGGSPNPNKNGLQGRALIS